MRNVFRSALILCLGLSSLAFTHSAYGPGEEEKDSITWYSWEEAMELQKENPKKIFIDVYTDWCGWCKRMDKTTFKNKAVAKVMNEHFYAVKFNAEQKESIEYKDHTLKYLPNAGRRGVHELAYALLDGRMGYPSFVYLDENGDRITISPGYKDAKAIQKELTFVGGEHYKNQSFNDFSESYGK
ncbi:MAG: DUF255 domain-containing protein [Saprospiraceae bacterium]|nr:DUF255 domain-containing protein [Saprospiraceae bacterium]